MTPKKKAPEEQKNKPLNQYLNYSALGLQIVIFIWGGATLGNWLDEKYPSDKKWFTLALVLISVTIAMIYTVKRLNQLNK